MIAPNGQDAGGEQPEMALIIVGDHHCVLQPSIAEQAGEVPWT